MTNRIVSAALLLSRSWMAAAVIVWTMSLAACSGSDYENPPPSTGSVGGTVASSTTGTPWPG